MTKLQQEVLNLRSYKRDLANHHRNTTLNGPEWDRLHTLLFDTVESQEQYIRELELYKSLGKYYDLWS